MKKIPPLRVATAGSIAIVVLLVAMLAIWHIFGSLRHAKAAAANGWIWVVPPQSGFDSEIRSGGSACNIFVVNYSGHVVEVLGIESECGCGSSGYVDAPLPIEVSAGKSQAIPLEIDPPENNDRSQKPFRVVVTTEGQLLSLPFTVTMD